jgi:hypothetical protein
MLFFELAALDQLCLKDPISLSHVNLASKFLKNLEYKWLTSDYLMKAVFVE